MDCHVAALLAMTVIGRGIYHKAQPCGNAGDCHGTACLAMTGAGRFMRFGLTLLDDEGKGERIATRVVTDKLGSSRVSRASQCFISSLTRYAVPEKHCRLTPILVFFDRCSNYEPASSAPGSAGTQFPEASGKQQSWDRRTLPARRYAHYAAPPFR